MNNIAQEKLQKIALDTVTLINEINDGVKWSDDFLKNEDKEETSYALKAYRRKLKKVRAAITQKPVIALFGASQVGKSYLVKNVLNDDKNNFKIPNHYKDSKFNDEYDFIADINPDGGGKESTSVVTRFTYESNVDTSRPSVKIKLISAKSLVTILVDSYLSDIKKRKNEITVEQVTQHLEKLPDLFSSNLQNDLDEDDVYDIEDYLDELFSGSNLQSKIQVLKDARFWHTVAASIHKIPYNKWSDVFNILWGKLSKFTELFNILVNELKNVNFSKEIYTDFDSILREPNGTILDVQQLKKLMIEQGDSLNVMDQANNNYTVRRNSLCALTHEVVVNISESSAKMHDFMGNIDMLDFPGARSRLKLDENEELSNEEISEMLLRGKVAYLFNSYSLNYEISNLFVCTRSQQTDVKEVPELINKWINHNIGKDKEERTQVLQNVEKPPLFIIFTWWNMQLTFDKDNDTVNGEIDSNKLSKKWAHRFEALIKEEVFGSFKWHINWTNTSKFRNYYLLRDFKYTADIFKGYEENNEETTLNENRKEYYQKLKESFVTSPLVKDFFPEPEEIWKKTSTQGNDGSQHIIDNMQKVASNRNKTQRYLKIINDAKAKVEKTLNEHYHSDDADEQIKKAAKDGSDLHATMNQIFGVDAYYFGSFIEHLTVSENEILEFYHELLKDNILLEKASTNQYILFRESSPDLSTEKSYEENLEVLRKDYHRDTLKETEQFFTEEKRLDLQELFYGELHNMKNKSQVLAENAREFWFTKKLNVDNFQFFIDLGFEKNLLEKLFDNLRTNFNKLNLVERIAKTIRNKVDRYNKVDEAEDMIAHMTAGIINEFVNSAGWSYYPQSEKEKIIETNQKNDLSLIIPEDIKIFEAIQKEDVERLFTVMDKLNEYLNERPIQFEKIKDVPMIKNYRRWRELLKISFIANCNIPTYNVEANRILKEILEKVKVHQFAI